MYLQVSRQSRNRRALPVGAPLAVCPRASLLLRGIARGFRLALLLSFGLLMSGCAGTPIVERFLVSGNAQGSVTEPSAVPHAMGKAKLSGENAAAIDPAPGTLVEIHDQASGVLLPVTFGRSYMAASGRRCAYYFRPGADTAGAKPSGIACRSGTAGWSRIPSRIPVSPGP